MYLNFVTCWVSEDYIAELDNSIHFPSVCSFFSASQLLKEGPVNQAKAKLKLVSKLSFP